MTTKLITALIAVALLSGCEGASKEDLQTRSDQNALKSWYWQLTGNIKTDKPVQIYDIDLFETPTETIAELHQRGTKVLCYFSAGSWEPNRPDSDQYPNKALGNTLEDWPDEKWVDIRNQQVRTILTNRIALATQKDCDGIEPDNVDGYAHQSGFPLTPEQQLAFNRFLAQTAHQYGLEIALKNDLDQIPELVDDFDLALNEECHQYRECDAYEPFIRKGKPVLNAEYDSAYRTNPEAREALCAQAQNEGISTLITNVELDGSEAYSCALNKAL